MFRGWSQFKREFARREHTKDPNELKKHLKSIEKQPNIKKKTPKVFVDRLLNVINSINN